MTTIQSLMTESERLSYGDFTHTQQRLLKGLGDRAGVLFMRDPAFAAWFRLTSRGATPANLREAAALTAKTQGGRGGLPKPPAIPKAVRPPTISAGEPFARGQRERRVQTLLSQQSGGASLGRLGAPFATTLLGV